MKAATNRQAWPYLSLAVLAIIVSILKTPQFPISDQALYEYFGRALLHGGTLYSGDLIDTKLPSIYLINALWQLFFGSNYFLHACAEAAVNLGSVALFAVMLRRAGVEAWALGTLVFAVFLSLPFPYLDTIYHYAVFFIVLAVCAAFYDRDLLAGASLAMATTFCFPAALPSIAILVARPARARILFLAGFAAFALLYVALMDVILGPHAFATLANEWQAYAALDDGQTLGQRISRLASTGLGAGVAAMLALVLLVAGRPASDSARFALLWSACAVAGLFVPPFLLADRFLLPVTPALAMAIAAFRPSLRDVRRRPMVAILALALLCLSAVNTVRYTEGQQRYALYVHAYGAWIRSSVRRDVNMLTYDYAPELPLAADATMLGVLSHPTDPLATPSVLVFGPYDIPEAVLQGKPVRLTTSAQKVLIFEPVCQPTQPVKRFFVVYVPPPKVGLFSCAAEPHG